jgi:glyoxylase-like metal-dependent hydrolase (beta-lactamase superfamily II)
VKMPAVEVAEGIHRLSQGVVNFYLVVDGDGLTLVDAGVPGDWSLLARSLTQLGRSPGDLAAIVLTHAHSDHTGFAERARSSGGTKVWIHQDDRDLAGGATTPKNERGYGSYLLRAEAYRTLVSLVRRGGLRIVPILELSTFADGEAIDVPGRPRAIHVPGHTPGSCAVLFEARRTVMTGDALVTRNPLTGRLGPQVAPAALNRDSAQALASLDALADLSADLVLPGHGDPWPEGPAEAVRLAKRAGPS